MSSRPKRNPSYNHYLLCSYIRKERSKHQIIPSHFLFGGGNSCLQITAMSVLQIQSRMLCLRSTLSRIPTFALSDSETPKPLVSSNSVTSVISNNKSQLLYLTLDNKEEIEALIKLSNLSINDHKGESKSMSSSYGFNRVAHDLVEEASNNQTLIETIWIMFLGFKFVNLSKTDY